MKNTVKNNNKSILQKSIQIQLMVTLISSLFILSCSRPSTKFVEQASKDISGSLGCTEVKSKIFDAFLHHD